MINTSVNRFGRTNGNKEHEMVYYNIDIINGRTNSSSINNDPIASFSETRDTPIINDASKYFMSIVRFTMNGIKDLPLFLPVVRTNQNDINQTVYEISLDIESNGVKYESTKPIMFRPESKSTILPQAPLLKQDLSTDYYFVHTYQHWLNLVNETFQTCLDDLQTQINASANPTSLSETAPYMIYDKDTQKFSIFVKPTAQYEIYFNTNMSNLFSNFDSERISDKDARGRFVRIFTRDLFGTNTVTLKGVNYLKITQEWNSTSTCWSPIESIVFTSNMLPIVSEQVSPPVVFGNSNVSNTNSSISAFEPIITDISLPLENAYQYKEFLSYTPTSEYRLVSMTSSQQEIKSVNISVFWKNRLDGSLVPLRMSNLSNISMKIMFRRKDLL